MIESLPSHLAEHLQCLGHAIDIGQRPTVFNGGFVGFNSAAESEVKSNGAQGQTHRSAAGSRTRRRAAARPRAQAARHHFRSDALETAFGAEFRLLAQHYEALATEDQHGLWVVVTSYPLGVHGPPVQFLLAVPLDERLAPRGWAFLKSGRAAELASLKHTNFPDASICAFTDEDGVWPSDDGILGLIDIFCIWMIKKWHREAFGWWPGRQAGICAFYRKREFTSLEQCGCLSGKRYGNCCEEADKLVDENFGRSRFRQLFGGDYENRSPPPEVMQAALSNWRVMPRIAPVYLYRFKDGEPLIY